MEIVIEELFFEQFSTCPDSFQTKFRKVYQQLKLVDDPSEVKGIYKIGRGFYKIIVGNSKISLQVKAGKAIIGLFLFNEYYFDIDD